MKGMLIRYAWRLVMLVVIYVASVMSLSYLMRASHRQYTPAFVLWKLHLWPYQKGYVTRGIISDRGDAGKPFIGRTIEEIQARFGGDFSLDHEREGSWPLFGEGTPIHGQITVYRIPGTWAGCTLVNGRCVELGMHKG